MTQQQILFENLSAKHESGWYRAHPYKSIGCVMHWLYVYSDLNISDNCSFNLQGNVKLGGEKLASYTFDDELQMPVFIFAPEYDWIDKMQQAYLTGLKTLNEK